MSNTAHEPVFQFPWRREFGRDTLEQQRDALAAELRAARGREEVLLRERDDLSQRQIMLAQEFEHRLSNGLQLIGSLLSFQSRAATTHEAAAQLTIVAGRVAALGRVHRQLHRLDHQDRVEFKQYLQHLCEDLSSLLFQQGPGHAIVSRARIVKYRHRSASRSALSSTS